jgi:D-2-hydroxyacid dehydrogenase (NADP+)
VVIWRHSVMKSHVLIAVDDLKDRHIQAISDALEGWATWERIDQEAPSGIYTEKLSRAEIVLGWPEPEWLRNSPVKLHVLPSAGYEDYLSKGLETKANFNLCNARGVYSIGIAEHFVALMMAFCRRIPLHVRDMQARTWRLFCQLQRRFSTRQNG